MWCSLVKRIDLVLESVFCSVQYNSSLFIEFREERVVYLQDFFVNGFVLKKFQSHCSILLRSYASGAILFYQFYVTAFSVTVF